MVRFVLIVAAIIDLALALLLVAVSGFVFGGGPESMHGGPVLAVLYAVAVIVCLAAPAFGFVFERRDKPGFAIALALMPPLGALAAMTVAPFY